jgi:NADPH-ferrihemoprotein reductase
MFHPIIVGLNNWILCFNIVSIKGRNVVVFYGSQTGTAEEFAGRLAKDCAGYGMKGMVADPEECEMV